MDYAKIDPEEPKVREVKEKHACNNMEGIRTENVKSLIMEGIKAEKVKSLIVVRFQRARLNLWVVGIVTLLLLRACVVQLRTLSETVAPRPLMFRSSFHVDIPAESKCMLCFVNFTCYD